MYFFCFNSSILLLTYFLDYYLFFFLISRLTKLCSTARLCYYLRFSINSSSSSCYFFKQLVKVCIICQCCFFLISSLTFVYLRIILILFFSYSVKEDLYFFTLLLFKLRMASLNSFYLSSSSAISRKVLSLLSLIRSINFLR